MFPDTKKPGTILRYLGATYKVFNQEECKNNFGNALTKHDQLNTAADALCEFLGLEVPEDVKRHNTVPARREALMNLYIEEVGTYYKCE